MWQLISSTDSSEKEILKVWINVALIYTLSCVCMSECGWESKRVFEQQRLCVHLCDNMPAEFLHTVQVDADRHPQKALDLCFMA